TSSLSDIHANDRILKRWIEIIVSGTGKYFVIPATVFQFALLLANPVTLFAIFSSHALHQETRFRLLANSLIIDLLYCSINFTVTATNISPVFFPAKLCDILLGLLLVVFFSGVLNITVMGVNIYLAVNWPLQYNSIITPSRAVKIIAAIWVLSSIVPLISFLAVSNDHAFVCEIPICYFNLMIYLLQPSSAIIEVNYITLVVLCSSCFVLIFVCFYLLVSKTRKSGIWNGMPSKARQTISIHSVIFIFYFLPTVLLIIQKILLSYKLIDSTSVLYVSMVINNIVLPLPKVLTPYLYGFRCMELSLTIQSLFKRGVQINP
uniref:G-protein coupled receptors family 1 profile domain-containing protein n=1 Tax=Lepisosteus oculatus TaxID=7918 RepID=W5NLJ6_LEPOC